MQSTLKHLTLCHPPSKKTARFGTEGIGNRDKKEVNKGEGEGEGHTDYREFFNLK